MPFLLALLLSGLVGFGLWLLLFQIYPQYKEIGHGFFYNSYYYIISFTFLSISICFFVYQKFKHIDPINLSIAPTTVWLIICVFLQIFLKGGAFLVFPLIFSLIALLILIYRKKSNLIFITLLAFPTIWIMTPYVKLFPLSLGLKMLPFNCLMIVLIFGLLLFVFGFYRQKFLFIGVSFFTSIVFFIISHLNSTFDINRPKPNSLIYIINSNTKEAFWGTFDKTLDVWTSKYVNSNINFNEHGNKNKFLEEINHLFTFKSKADIIDIPEPKIRYLKDTVINDIRNIKIEISHNRNVNRMELYLNTLKINSCTINGISLSKKYLNSRTDDFLFTHIITNNESTILDLEVFRIEAVELTLFESSFNLLDNNYIKIDSRPDWCIPKPFILNDAIILRKKLKL